MCIRKITSTNNEIGVEVNKASGLSETNKTDTRALGSAAEYLTNQELLAVIMSGDKEAAAAAANLLIPSTETLYLWLRRPLNS